MEYYETTTSNIDNEDLINYWLSGILNYNVITETLFVVVGSVSDWDVTADLRCHDFSIIENLEKLDRHDDLI